MSNITTNVTPLTKLAKFVGKSPLSSDDEKTRRAALDSLRASLEPNISRKKISELIDIVMIRSARARRKGCARVNIDLDVFSPDNKRAVKLML